MKKLYFLLLSFLLLTRFAALGQNDLCAGAININCGQTITGTTVGATSDAVGTCVEPLNTAPGVWYSFTGDGQITTLSLCGSGYDTQIGIFSGTCAALVCVTGNDDACGLQSQVSFTSVLGTNYFVLVTGFGTSAGTFSLARTCISASAPVNDLCSGAINIGCAQTITGTTFAANADAVGTCTTALGTAPGVWYSFTGDGLLNTLSLCGSGFDTKIGIFSGTCGALVCVAGNDDDCGLQSSVTFTAVLGANYFVLVTGFGTNSGAFTLARTCTAPAVNDFCSGAINIGCAQTITGTTSTATVDAVGTCTTPLGTAPGVWYSFTGDGSITTLSLCGSAFDTKIGVFSGTCAGLTCVIGNDDFCGLQSQLTFNTVIGTNYFVLVTGFGTNSGIFTLARTCVFPCAGAPTAGTISGPATSCGANSVTLALSGNTIGLGISIQWKSAAVSGGPYTNISGATNASYIFTPTPGTIYFIATVTCANSGISSNTAQKSLIVTAPVHSAASATVTTVCTPGAATITGTAINGAAGNYVHSLTGPGTIVQTAPTGANNSTGNFTVTNLPAGNHSFILTTTDALGCNAISTIVATIKQTPIITISPVAGATICNGQIQPINVSVLPPVAQTFSQNATILVPGGTPTLAGIGNPYPSQISIAGLPTTGVTVKSVKLGNVNHTFPDDMDIVLVSPTGQSVIIMSDAGGGTDAIGLDYTFDDAAASLMANATFNPQGTYRPTNFGTPDVFPAPGPGSITQATPTLASFSGNPNGDWKLYVVDGFNGDFGFIGNWSITFNISSLATFSPLTNLFTDGNATIAYTGTPTSVIFAKPTATTLYTASANVDGCTNAASVNIAVNQVPAITTQPTPAAQTICPGFNVTYSVAATGTGITYQWRLGAVNLVNNAQIAGATTNTLTITNVSVANAGSYTCVVTGTCTPAVTSTAAVLTVSTAPVISTQPVASVTICAGASTSLTTVATGVPVPTIYQWQVSTNAGVTWTNLLTDGSFTPTYSIVGATVAMNNNRYRVLVTNSCGQTTTSTTTTTLLVNPLPTVTGTALVNRICISDTLTGLSGSPVGGTWSGIGVSGFNFVPSATAVGTYNLAYTFTSALGCTATATIAAKVEECQERLRLMENNALIVYPNPNRGRFNVRINSSLYEYIGMKVYNAQGQIVNGKMVNDVLTAPIYSGLVFGRVIPVDLTHLPAGVYLVKFYFDGGVRSSEKAFKVIIGSH